MNELNEHLRDTFRAAGLRLTSQRQLILEVLQESSDHLDADTLYDQAKTRASDISLATVYRTLAVLKELDLVEEHRLGEGHCHYEAVRADPHYHFTCRGCGKVIEFDTSLVAQIEQELSEREGARVIDAHLHLIGYCAQCKDNAGEQSNYEK